MNLKCVLGMHTWNGCKCPKCGKTRDESHVWGEDCERCVKCGKIRDDTSLIEALWGLFWKAADKGSRGMPHRDLPRMLNLYARLKDRLASSTRDETDQLAAAAIEIARALKGNDQIAEARAWLENALEYAKHISSSQTRDSALIEVASLAEMCRDPLLWLRAEGNYQINLRFYKNFTKDIMQCGVAAATQVVTRFSKLWSTRTIYKDFDLEEIAVAFAVRAQDPSIEPLRCLVRSAHRSSAALAALLTLLRPDGEGKQSTLIPELIRIAEMGIPEIVNDSRPNACLDMAECLLHLRRVHDAEVYIARAVGATSAANLSVWQQVDRAGSVLHERNDQMMLERDTANRIKSLRELADRLGVV